MRLAALTILLSAGSVFAGEVVVATRTIRAKEIISAKDVTLKQGKSDDAMTQPSELLGLEAKVALYPGRPIRPSDVGPPAIIARNDLVSLVFDHGGLRIATDGRALGRGAAGDRVRVMNLASRTTVVGEIRPDGTIEVK